MAIGITSLIAMASKHVGLPDRVTQIESYTHKLSEGQTELGRRVDLMGADLSGMRREFEASSRRLDVSFGEVLKQLAQISGTVSDVRESARDAGRATDALREKVTNALTIADEAIRTAQEAKSAAEKSK